MLAYERCELFFSELKWFYRLTFFISHVNSLNFAFRTGKNLNFLYFAWKLMIVPFICLFSFLSLDLNFWVSVIFRILIFWENLLLWNPIFLYFVLWLSTRVVLCCQIWLGSWRKLLNFFKTRTIDQNFLTTLVSLFSSFWNFSHCLDSFSQIINLFVFLNQLNFKILNDFSLTLFFCVH